MRNSIIIVLFFILGIVLGRIDVLPGFFLDPDLSTYVLYALLFLVGIVVGSDPRAWGVIRRERSKVLLVPASVVLGSWIGVIPCAFILGDISIREALAVGSGFGYYSLSSILISEIHSNSLGTVALFSNISREILTLLAAPLMAAWFGKLAPIASGGATSMDTTLPIITKSSGREYTMISVFSGFVLTLLVPVLVTIILT